MSGNFVHRQTNALQRGSATGFSLVEMLAVMGIIVLMLAVTVPAFKGLNQSGARKAAVSNLMGALDRARTMAVSDGRATYVAFYAARVPPDGAITNASTGPWGNAYAIYQDADNVKFEPMQQTPWIPLPTGMAFKVDESNQMTSVTNMANLYPAMLGDPDAAQPSGSDAPQFPVSAAGSTNKKHLYLPFIKFDNTGAVDFSMINLMSSRGINPATYLRVLIFPGFLKADGSEAVTQAGGNTNANILEEIDINPVTGRSRYVVNPADNLASASPASKPQS